MAITYNGSSGTATSTSAGTSLAITVATTALTAGRLAVVQYAKDNTSTTDADNSEVTSVTDSSGNLWQKGKEFTNNVSGAASGATCGIWFSNIKTTVAIGGTVTLNFASCTAKAASLFTFTSDISGVNYGLDGTPGTNQGNASSNPGSISVTTQGQRPSIRIRAVACESNSSTALGKTSAFTAVTPQAVANSGTSSTSMGVRGEYLISTSTGVASGPTIPSCDSASVYICLEESVADPIATAAAELGSPRLVPLGYTQHHLAASFSFNAVTDTATHSMPGQSKPGYLQSYVDQVFNTVITRVSDDPGNAVSGLAGCVWGDDCHVQYIKRSPWNCDDTVFFLDTNSGGSGTGGIMLDGQTFAPLYNPTNKPSERIWHPKNPDLMIGTNSSSNQMVTYVPSTNTKTTIKTFTGYSSINLGPWKGNLSNDGAMVVVRGTRTSDSADVCFAYNIDTDTQYPDIVCNSHGTTAGHAEISMLGNYVLINYSEDDHIGVFNAYTGAYLYSTAAGHPTHYSQIVIDGIEYMVGRNSGSPNSGLIGRTKISDGSQVMLSTTGYARETAVDHSPSYGSYLTVTDMETTSPYTLGELLSTYCDHGDTKAYRIGYSQNIRFGSDYETEVMPQINRRGDKVVFSSDWLDTTDGRPVQLYVVSIPRGLATQAAFLGSPALTINPAFTANPLATGAASLGSPALSINGAVTQIFVADAMNRADQNTGSMRAICTLADDSQGSIRVKWACLPSSGANWYGSEVQHMSFGKWDGNTSSADTTATPIELKFSGASGFDLSGAPQDVEAIIWSDWTEHPGLTLSAGDKVVIIWDTNPSVWNHSAQETTTGASSNNKTWISPTSTATSWDQQNVTGWLSLTEGFCVEEIDTQAAGGGGAVDLVAVGIAAGAASLGHPALTLNSVSLTANPLTTSAASLGSPVLSQVSVLTANQLATGAASLGTPAFSQNNHLSAAPLATQAASLGTPAISQCHVLTATPLATGAASLGSPAFSSAANPLPAANALATGAAFLGQPAFTQKHVLVGAALYTGPPSLGTPAISQNHSVAATALATAAASLGTPALSQNHKLTANTLATGAAGLSQPTLGIAGLMAALPLATGAASLGSPALSQNHHLTATVLATGAASLGQPAYIRNLVASALGTAAASLGSPALHQAHVIAASPLSTASPALGTPAIAQNHGLVASSLATGAASLGSPALSQNHHLAATALSGQQSALGSPAIGQRHALAADPVTTGAASLGRPDLVRKVELAADDLATGSSDLGSPEFFAWLPSNLLVPVGIATQRAFLGSPAFAQLFKPTRPGRILARSVQRVRLLVNLDSRERTLVRKQFRVRTIKRQ